jgi:hypothetical protein
MQTFWNRNLASVLVMILDNQKRFYSLKKPKIEAAQLGMLSKEANASTTGGASIGCHVGYVEKVWVL